MNKRKFSRVSFRIAAVFLSTKGESRLKVINLSLKGMLCEVETGSLAFPDEGEITITLNEETSITIKARLVHENKNEFGFLFGSVDADSMRHLRQIMELNSGDSRLFEKEMSFLQPY